MNKILISIESFPPDYTGAGLRAYRFSKRMHEKYDYNYDILSLKSSKNQTSSFDNLNVKRLRIFTPKIIFPVFIVELMIRVNLYLFKNRKRIDVIHFFSFFWLNRIVMLSNVLFYKKKSIIELTLDGGDDPLSLISKNLLNKLFKKFTLFLINSTDKIVSQTEYSLNSCLNVGINREKIWLRPNPIDEKIFGSISLKQKNQLRKKLNLPDKFIFLSIGIIQSRKNQLFLVKCIKQLKNKNVILILIGPPDLNEDYYEKLVSYIKQNKLSSKVMILDEKSNVNEYMIASDAFVFASKKEGFGNVLAEALMSGLPVVSSDLVGIRKYVNARNGRTINIANKKEQEAITEFVDALNYVYAKKRTYNYALIRKMAIKCFSAKKIDRQYHEYYQYLLRRP